MIQAFIYMPFQFYLLLSLFGLRQFRYLVSRIEKVLKLMANVNFRCEDDFKSEFDNALKSVGITQTDLFIDAMKYVIQHKRSPFMKMELLKTIQDIKQELIPKLIRVDEIASEINKTSKPQQLKEYMYVIEDFVNSFTNINNMLANTESEPEFIALRTAYNHAYMLLIALYNTDFDGEGNVKFPANFNSHLEWMRAAFRAAIK